jgi:hypothetical protein
MPEPNTGLIPINPFALGGAFLERSIRLGWVTKHRADGRTTYFLTPSGTIELEKLGIDTTKVRSYRVLTELDQKEAEAKKKAYKAK